MSAAAGSAAVVVHLLVVGALCASCAAVSVPSSPVSAAPLAQRAPGPLRVLLIGNSQLGFFGDHPEPPDLAAALTAVAASAHEGAHPLDVRRVVRPGGSCADFAADGTGPGTPLGAVADPDVDVVVLFPSIDELDRRVHGPCWDLFREQSLRAGHAFAIVATPHVSQAYPQGFDALHDAVGGWARDRGVAFVPAGAAWRRALGDAPARERLLSLFHGDLEHPGPEGSYLTVLALYAVLTGARVVDAGIDNDIAPLRCDPRAPCLDEQQMRDCLNDDGDWQCAAGNGAVFSNHRVHFVTDDEAAQYQRVVDAVTADVAAAARPPS